MPINRKGGGVAAGTVAHFAANTAPAGWVKANGAAVSRSTYAALFAAIGTVYGVGDGSTTFNVPDLRGEFVRSWDDARGVDSGRAIGTAQAADLASHSHAMGILNGTGGGGWTVNSATGSNAMSTGAAGGAETRPRNVAMLACIKY